MDEASTLTRQMSLDLSFHTHGGARPGAGRPCKKESERSFIVHRARPVHRAYEPVHITMRVIKGLPSLRSQVLARIINRCMRAQRKKLALEEKARFQLVDFNIQENHLHLIAEAADKRGLASGLMGLAIRITIHLNRRLKRKGRLWADRYHSRDLRSPRQTRNAMCSSTRRSTFTSASSASPSPTRVRPRPGSTASPMRRCGAGAPSTGHQ